jgi:hypothetical protein
MPQNDWTEQVPQAFIDYGWYVVPKREQQWRIIVDLIPRLYRPCTIIARSWRDANDPVHAVMKSLCAII